MGSVRHGSCAISRWVIHKCIPGILNGARNIQRIITENRGYLRVQNRGSENDLFFFSLSCKHCIQTTKAPIHSPLSTMPSVKMKIRVPDVFFLLLKILYLVDDLQYNSSQCVKYFNRDKIVTTTYVNYELDRFSAWYSNFKAA